MVEGLERWAAERGYRVGWGPPSVVATAREDVLSRKRSGELEGAFYAANLAELESCGPAWEGAAAVVVVVVPRPAHRVAFTVAGREVGAVFPPTYVRHRPMSDDVRDDLRTHGLPGARVERVEAPLKSLAARLGLVRYGRTNVTYAPEIGSYIQLFGYLTDAALPIAPGWRPRAPELLPECAECSVCLASCPTGAIAPDRVLLHGERCLVAVNEREGEWPDWVPRAAHNAIVGCLLCQRPCPANPELPVEETGIVFSAQETEALLAGRTDRDGPARDGIRAKLDRLGRMREEAVLGRNLRALLEARPPAA